MFIDATLSTNELEMRESAISTEESNKSELDNLIEVVSFIFNSRQCWHYSLEQLCTKVDASDNAQASQHLPCDHSCPHCSNTLDQFMRHDTAEHANNNDKQHNWMKWDDTAANWIACKLPDCTLEGFVYGSLME